MSNGKGNEARFVEGLRSSSLNPYLHLSTLNDTGVVAVTLT